jgi:Putative Ig domain
MPAILSATLLIGSCSDDGRGPPPDPPSPISITTSALPNGQVGQPYAARLAATGGKAPLSWATTAGALPAGITLSAATGTISGTPTTTAAGTPLTFTVTDASTKPQSKSVMLNLNVSPASITVAISPARGALTLNQSLTLTVTTNDYAGVHWSVTPAAAGSLSAASSASGDNVTFTAPDTAGVYTITATSVTNSAERAATTIGVTDLAGVYTYHNDLARDGANTQEYALTTANVNTATFGKLFSCSVDGAVYAQPLWVANLTVGGGTHNVVLVATQHDSLYAFDADANPCQQLWHANLIDSSHGATTGETSVPSGIPGYLVGQGGGDITPEVGVTGTPVIDPSSGIIYVVSKSVNPAGPTLYQRLHAIDAASGNEESGAPIAITAAMNNTAGTYITFSAQQENQRAGLALVNGVVYIAWASHEDVVPWYGWMTGYAYGSSGFVRTALFNTAPDTGEAGVWMSGGAPAADSLGRLYAISGNGKFDITNTSVPNHDYGDCFLQLNSSLGVTSWFAPTDEDSDFADDKDFGAGGAALVLEMPTGPFQHLVVGGGKDGTLYVLNGDNMGGLGDPNAWQTLGLGHAIFSTAVFWNNTLYLAPASSALQAFAFDPATDLFNSTPTSQSPTTAAWPPPSASLSASGTGSNGIVWSLDARSFCGTSGCGPAVLHAYDASNLASELWNSAMLASDAAGNAVKFTVPTVANGKVYVGTRGNNTGGVFGSTSVSGELDVYGLKPD